MLKKDLFCGYNVDVNIKALNEVIDTKAHFSQENCDTAIFIFSLNVDDEILDITDCKVNAEVLRNDNRKVTLKGRVLNDKKGLVAVKLNRQALACVGENSIKLIIQYNDQQICSSKMTYIVHDNFNEDNLILKSVQGLPNEYLREYGVDIHIDKPEQNVIDTKAVFIKGEKNTSLLKMNLLFGDEPMNLDGYTVTANVKESQKEVITILATIKDSSQGVVNLELPANIVDEEGKNTFELTLHKDGKVIISHKYVYTVLGSLGEGRFGEETDITLLQSLIKQVQESKDGLDTMSEDFNRMKAEYESYRNVMISESNVASLQNNINTKIEDVTISENVLTFIANSQVKKKITLPTSINGGSSGSGVNGREIELQKGETHIQWRYAGDEEWKNLVALSDLKGSQGEKGADGQQGLQGERGNDGKSAYQIALENNFVGSQEEWLKSLKGRDGVDGAKGERGEKGEQGIQGERGLQGVKGDNGVGISTVSKTATSGLIDTYTILYTDDTQTTFTVTNGAKGEQGIQGERGLTGLTGAKGERGEKGEKGDTPDMSNYYSKNQTDQKILEEIAKASLEKGEIDLSSYATKTFVTEEIQKIELKQGESAYDIAKKNGYIGSESEWLASLKGLKGDTGAKGEQGLQGIQGIQGVQGERGLQGVKGDKGIGISTVSKTATSGLIDTYTILYTDDTQTTFTVTNGAKGERGLTGAKGEQGLQGLQGERGLTGATGERGQKGADGKTTYVHIKYSSISNPTQSTQISSSPNAYIGIYSDFNSSASTDPSRYTWSRFQGLQGERGLTGAKGERGEKGEQGIQGERGLTGATGERGETGPQGIQGERGLQGPVGPAGERGEKGNGISKIQKTNTSGLIDTYTILYTDDTQTTFTVTNGAKGDKGQKGEQGIQGKQGIQGERGLTGAKGEQGQKGEKGDTGVGLVAGGTTGQILVKKSNLDYDTQWTTLNTKETWSKISASGGVLQLNTNKYQYVQSISSGTEIILPTISGNTVTEIHLFFNANSDLTLVLPSCKWQTTPDFKNKKTYELIFTYFNGAWLGGVIVYE